MFEGFDIFVSAGLSVLGLCCDTESGGVAEVGWCSPGLALSSSSLTLGGYISSLLQLSRTWR